MVSEPEAFAEMALLTILFMQNNDAPSSHCKPCRAADSAKRYNPDHPALPGRRGSDALARNFRVAILATCSEVFSMGTDRVLVVGFEPYGGRGFNPAGEIARALDGRSVAGAYVFGRRLPVTQDALRRQLPALVAEIQPVVALGVGLWPGEPVIRIERFGINLADFEIPDNTGMCPTDEALDPAGPTARAATLPVRRIEAALLQAGIPARLSETAGTFLCNMTLYTLLEIAAAGGDRMLCGFVHIPYAPAQVAAMLQGLRQEAKLERHQRADLASMEFATSVRAAEIALGVSIEFANAG